MHIAPPEHPSSASPSRDRDGLAAAVLPPIGGPGPGGDRRRRDPQRAAGASQTDKGMPALLSPRSRAVDSGIEERRLRRSVAAQCPRRR